jgi:hypothetical protein
VGFLGWVGKGRGRLLPRLNARGPYCSIKWSEKCCSGRNKAEACLRRREWISKKDKNKVGIGFRPAASRVLRFYVSTPTYHGACAPLRRLRPNRQAWLRPGQPGQLRLLRRNYFVGLVICHCPKRAVLRRTMHWRQLAALERCTAQYELTRHCVHSFSAAPASPACYTEHEQQGHAQEHGRHSEGVQQEQDDC